MSVHSLTFFSMYMNLLDRNASSSKFVKYGFWLISSSYATRNIPLFRYPSLCCFAFSLLAIPPSDISLFRAPENERNQWKSWEWRIITNMRISRYQVESKKSGSYEKKKKAIGRGGHVDIVCSRWCRGVRGIQYAKIVNYLGSNVYYSSLLFSSLLFSSLLFSSLLFSSLLFSSLLFSSLPFTHLLYLPIFFEDLQSF